MAHLNRYVVVLASTLLALFPTSAIAGGLDSNVTNSSPAAGAKIKYVYVSNPYGAIQVELEATKVCNVGTTTITIGTVHQDLAEGDMILSVLLAALLSGKKIVIQSEIEGSTCWIKQVQIIAQ